MAGNGTSSILICSTAVITGLLSHAWKVRTILIFWSKNVSFPWRMWLSSTLEVIPKPSECLTASKAKKAKTKAKKDQTKTKRAKQDFHIEGRKINIFQGAGGKFHFLSRDRNISCPGTGNRFFLPLFEIFFWPFFWPFLLKRAGRGWNTHFWCKKVVGHFF